MIRRKDFTRRDVLASVSAAALFPMRALGQGAPRVVDFAERCRELSGFDPVPRSLVEGALRLLDDTEATAFVAGHDAAAEVEKTVLKALYTGMHDPGDGEPERFAYAEALMYAAIEDTVNVPSYCGGMPGFWADPPAET